MPEYSQDESGLALVWGRLSTEEHKAGIKECMEAPANPHAIANLPHSGYHQDIEAGTEVGICIPQLTVALVGIQKVESIQMFSGR